MRCLVNVVAVVSVDFMYVFATGWWLYLELEAVGEVVVQLC